MLLVAQQYQFHLVAAALILLSSFAITGIIYLRYFYVDYSTIRGLPEIPDAPLLSGHLYMLGDDHASKAEEWSKTHEWPVYQVRMGNRRAVMINSFSAAKEWIIKNQSATIDRPSFYTFHGVVSSTSGALFFGLYCIQSWYIKR